MNNLISTIISVILSALTKDKYKVVVDKLLDVVEDAIKASNTKIDDLLVLPLCKKARELLNVPDDDEPLDTRDPDPNDSSSDGN